MQQEIKKQLERADSVEVELEHHDIDEYRFEGNLLIETEDYDVEFDVLIKEEGETTYYGLDSPSEWRQDSISIDIDNVRAYHYEQDKEYTVVDREIEDLIKTKIEIR